MYQKQITYCGQRAKVACDGKCTKAWGRNRRPVVTFDPSNRDDFAYLSDKELGEAPEDPGTYEGGCAKPRDRSERLNKWCIRECERCSMSNVGAYNSPIKLRKFGNRVYNIPGLHKKTS